MKTARQTGKVHYLRSEAVGKAVVLWQSVRFFALSLAVVEPRSVLCRLEIAASCLLAKSAICEAKGWPKRWSRSNLLVPLHLPRYLAYDREESFDAFYLADCRVAALLAKVVNCYTVLVPLMYRCGVINVPNMYRSGA